MDCTLIEHGFLVPVTRDEVIEDGAVAFDGSRIVYAGPAAGLDRQKFKPTRTIDARGKAILPGLVNTHIHLVGAYMKGLTEDVPGRSDTAGLYKRGFPVVCSLQPDDYYSGCMTHALEMVMTGTTTFSSTWMQEKQAGPVVRDLGVRAALSEWIIGTDLLKLSAQNMERPWDPAGVERGLDAAVDLYETWHGKADGRITTRISPAGPGYLSDEGIEKCRDLAAKQGVGVNIHIAEVPGETEFVMGRYGKRPMELGRDLGILTRHTIGFHCVFLNDSDVEIMAETGMNLSHTSFHTPKRGYFPPMAKVYAKGVSVSLGSDWCSNDLWKFMRAAALFPRVQTGDVGIVSGYDALRLATVGGAHALGMENEIGTLEAGKKADIILVDVMTPWCQPIRKENFITDLVFNANGSDVTDVIVDGRTVVENRQVKTVDAPAIMRDCQQRAERLWASASRNW
ncbi:MAG TPA: amidohydrolase family protein [Hyphomicrobiaceae bacterium]|nr:amidohydrolase family protein [Hyphomicrobiaceae bacterium]